MTTEQLRMCGWVAIKLSSIANHRNRGTEFIKSPEMLLVANASKKEAKWYDRRKRQGAGEDRLPSPQCESSLYPWTPGPRATEI